jgi:preprotein translocase subunit SecA
MLQIINKLFGGSKSEKDVKKIQYLVPVINGHFEAYKTLSHDQLRNKTEEFKFRIKTHLESIDQVITEAQNNAEALDIADLLGKDAIYQEIDKLKKDRDQALEEVLWTILPEAYAVVK